MRELSISEMSIIGGGLSLGDQAGGGFVIAAGGAYTATQAAAVGALLGTAVGLVMIGGGTFLVADAYFNNGRVWAQVQGYFNPNPDEDQEDAE